MIDIIYKTVKRLHSKKMQIMQDIKILALSHPHNFWLNFDKANHSFRYALNQSIF